MGEARVIETAAGITLATEAFGVPEDPALLMIMGATASMLWWPEELCEALAAGGRHVIRYDNRDTGQSTTGAPGKPGYGIDEMAQDALAVLDAYGIARAHLVGMSLGGMIAQIAALVAPERVASLSLIASAAFDEDDPDLPPFDPTFLAHLAGMTDLDWADREAVVTFQAQSFRLSAGTGSGLPFDRRRAEWLARREFDRAIDPRAALNHAQVGGGEGWAGKLGQIAAPAVVIHGLYDPILSFRHGQRLAQKLGGAPMVELEAGHELAARDLDRIAAAILDLTSGSEPPRSPDLQAAGSGS